MAGNRKSRINRGLCVIVGGLIVTVGIAYFVGHGGNPSDADAMAPADQGTSAPPTEK